MRRFWFGLSLVLVFMFAAVSSYIFFVFTGAAPEVDKPYKAAGGPGEMGEAVPRVTADMTLNVRESYACGYITDRTLAGNSEFLGLSFDQLTKEGWNVARTGENRLELVRQYADICPIEQQKRLLKKTERGIAVYAGTAEHLGAMLLEMPTDFAELPPDMNTALAKDGYAVNSDTELNELLESLDETVHREP